MAIRAHSVANLMRKKYKYIDFTGEFRFAFGNPEAVGCWFISGHSANGKSTFAQQLAKYFDEEKKKSVAYFSVEEATAATMQKAAIAAGWRKTGSRIKILEGDTIEELGKWLEKRKSSNIIIIDTLQRWIDDYGVKLSEIREMHRKFPERLFIYISHVDEKGQPEKSPAKKIQQDSALKVWVEGYRAFSKGRTFGEKDAYFSIWKERGVIYHIEN